MPDEIKELIRDCYDGRITRRQFLRRAVIFTGSFAAANALITGSMQSHVAAQVDRGDSTILSQNVEYIGKAGTVFALSCSRFGGGQLSRARADPRESGIERSYPRRGAPLGQRRIRDAGTRLSFSPRWNAEGESKKGRIEQYP